MASASSTVRTTSSMRSGGCWFEPGRRCPPRAPRGRAAGTATGRRSLPAAFAEAWAPRHLGAIRDLGRSADATAGRIERDPAVAREVDLDPGVGGAVPDRLDVAQSLTGQEALDEARGDPVVRVGLPQQHRHRRGVVEAVAALDAREALHLAGVVAALAGARQVDVVREPARAAGTSSIVTARSIRVPRGRCVHHELRAAPARRCRARRAGASV